MSELHSDVTKDPPAPGPPLGPGEWALITKSWKTFCVPELLLDMRRSFVLLAAPLSPWLTITGVPEAGQRFVTKPTVEVDCQGSAKLPAPPCSEPIDNHADKKSDTVGNGPRSTGVGGPSCQDGQQRSLRGPKAFPRHCFSAGQRATETLSIGALLHARLHSSVRCPPHFHT